MAAFVKKKGGQSNIKSAINFNEVKKALKN